MRTEHPTDNQTTSREIGLTRQAIRTAAEYEARAQEQLTSLPATPRVSEVEIAALFDRWNASLQTLDPARVVANYAPRSVLLPTLSGRPRFTDAEKLDYFRGFLAMRPLGMIDQRLITVSAGAAVDAGMYTFFLQATGETCHARYTFSYGWDGSDWLITSHHSSVVPTEHQGD